MAGYEGASTVGWRERWCLAAGTGHTAFEAAEGAGLVHFGTGVAGAAAPIVGAAAGLWLGIHELMEAKVKGDEMAARRFA